MLLDKFVCVRLVQMYGVDLNKFQFDFVQTWAIFYMNADAGEEQGPREEVHCARNDEEPAQSRSRVHPLPHGGELSADVLASLGRADRRATGLAIPDAQRRRPADGPEEAIDGNRETMNLGKLTEYLLGVKPGSEIALTRSRFGEETPKTVRIKVN